MTSSQILGIVIIHNLPDFLDSEPRCYREIRFLASDMIIHEITEEIDEQHNV